MAIRWASAARRDARRGEFRGFAAESPEGVMGRSPGSDENKIAALTLESGE
jgi:hypothetical protein